MPVFVGRHIPEQVRVLKIFLVDDYRSRQRRLPQLGVVFAGKLDYFNVQLVRQGDIKDAQVVRVDAVEIGFGQ